MGWGVRKVPSTGVLSGRVGLGCGYTRLLWVGQGDPLQQKVSEGEYAPSWVLTRVGVGEERGEGEDDLEE